MIVVDLPPIHGIAEKTKWAEAYETQHTIGYVYTVPEFAMAVYFAVRDLI
jgi:hypothetical protein